MGLFGRGNSVSIWSVLRNIINSLSDILSRLTECKGKGVLAHEKMGKEGRDRMVNEFIGEFSIE